MTPRQIHAATQAIATADPPSPEGAALIELRALVVGFIDATEHPDAADSMKAMSIDQVRLLNQLHLAVGL